MLRSTLHMLSVGMPLALFAFCQGGCDTHASEPLEDATSDIVYCEAFDVRCLPCEAAGEGATCEVQDKPGTCRKMRILQGPQVYIAGLRCRADSK